MVRSCSLVGPIPATQDSKNPRSGSLSVSGLPIVTGSVKRAVEYEAKYLGWSRTRAYARGGAPGRWLKVVLAITSGEISSMALAIFVGDAGALRGLQHSLPAF